MAESEINELDGEVSTEETSPKEKRGGKKGLRVKKEKEDFSKPHGCISTRENITSLIPLAIRT